MGHCSPAVESRSARQDKTIATGNAGGATDDEAPPAFH